MPRALRLLICCLMALALPVQAMAAAVRLHCVAGGTQVHATAQQSGMVPALGHHARHTVSSSPHAAAAATATAAATAAAADLAAGDLAAGQAAAALPPCHLHPAAPAAAGPGDGAGFEPTPAAGAEAGPKTGPEADADASRMGTADSAQSDEPPNLRCSACAACSVGLALAPQLATWPDAPSHSPWVSASPTTLASVALALLERPPRPGQA